MPTLGLPRLAKVRVLGGLAVGGLLGSVFGGEDND